MKKGLILFLMFLFSLNPANAQEIVIFGQSYSLILIAPVIFMAVISLFFLGIIIKDNIGKIRLPKINFSKFKGVHHEKKEAAKKLTLDHLNRFNILKNKSSKINPQQAFSEFGEIAKEFFKDKFNLKHEFAFAELGDLIKGHVKDINLANKISVLKYSGAVVTSLQIKSLFDDFDGLLKEYNVKDEKQETKNLFAKLKENFLDRFKKKEIRLVPHIKIKEKVIDVKSAKEQKPSLLLNWINKLKIHRKEEIIKKPEAAKKYKFVLFANITNKIRKLKILSLIKKGKKAMLLNPLSAKRYYARALFSYYKLPLNEEKEIANELMSLHNEILSRRSNEKIFLDVSKNLINVKHKGKHISKESISLINTLKNFIEREELLAAEKLKEFSHKLKNEERKLGHFLPKEREIFNEPELKQKTINLVDNYKPRLDFLYKQPQFKIEHEKKEKETKIENRNLRTLQKQRNERYNKLLELEEGKLSHDKLN